MKKLASTLPNMILSLVGICIVVASLLAILNSLTMEPIAQAKAKAKMDALGAVLPPFDNDPSAEGFPILLEGEKDSLMIYPARSKGVKVGYAIESYTDKGFSGRIAVMIGINMQGRLVDFSVLESNETPGLGTRISEWYRDGRHAAGIKDIRGLDLKQYYPLRLDRDGGAIDGITAATISSRAFMDAINRAYQAQQLASQNNDK